MAVSEYKKPIELSPETQQWISNMDGKIRYARKNPKTAQTGVNPEFWQRLKASTIKTIPSGNQKASHKMSYGEVDGKIIVFPMIQEVDGQLVDMSSDSKKALDSALKTNNYIVAPNEDIAKNFTEFYKESGSFPAFQKFNPISNIRYNNIVMKNKDRVLTAYSKLLKSGYSPEQAAGVLGNLVVEGGLDEKSQENGGKGVGLAQWTTQNRQDAMRVHVDPSFSGEFERQLDFLIKEAKDKNIWTRPATTKTSFEQQRVPYQNPSAQKATVSFMQGYENPKKSASHEKDRVEIANYIMSPDFQNEYQMSLAYHKKGGVLNYLNYFN